MKNGSLDSKKSGYLKFDRDAQEYLKDSFHAVRLDLPSHAHLNLCSRTETIPHVRRNARDGRKVEFSLLQDRELV